MKTRLVKLFGMQLKKCFEGFSPRFMEVLPFGDKLFKYCLLYLSIPSLGFDVTEWDLAFKWIVPLAAVTVVSLVISSVILEKRDVR